MAQSSVSPSVQALPIKSEFPLDNATDVKPTTPITIALDPSSANFTRFHQQFVNGRFSVLINDQPVQSTYDDSNYAITVQHAPFSRYTNYTVTLLVKAATNGNTASGKAADSFSFETGSAIGEATHVTASLSNPSVSVDNGGTLNVTARDDHDDPATNATISVTGTGGFIPPSDLVITNGSGSVSLNDHKAASVTSSYTVKDGNYNDQADDTTTGIASETFVPGAPKSMTLVPAQNTVQAGNVDVVAGDVYDQYGNLATNDTDSVNVSLNGGTSSAVPINTGTFTYSLGPIDDEKVGAYTISASDANVTGVASIQVTPGPIDVATSVVSVDKQFITAGDSVTVSVTPKDQYGNPLGNGQTVIVSDGSSGSQLQWNSINSDYEGQFSENSAGTVVYSVTVDGTQLTSSPIVTVDSDTVTFPDHSLETVIRKALDIPTGPITRQDMLQLTTLSVWDAGVLNLDGIQYASNLTTLNLDASIVYDLRPLSTLHHLSSLSLYANRITDISPLSACTSITQLNLTQNSVYDISALSNLTNLTNLDLQGNPISDLSPLRNLTKLTYLGLDAPAAPVVNPVGQ